MDSLSEIFNIDGSAVTKTYKKGTMIQREGDTANYGLYVKKGLLRAYTIDEKAKEHVFIFASEGWIISDIESFEFKHPTRLYIDCIEDSEVLLFKLEQIGVSNLTEEQYRTNIKMLSRRAGMLQRRVLMLMSASAIERYQDFLETYPELSNRLSQKLIASYLGITPEALSKLRGDLARSK